MSNSLQPHGLQDTRLPCPWLSPGVCLNSYPLGQWCCPTISVLSPSPLTLNSIFPSIRVFSNELALCLRWPKYWSFSISASNGYLGLISFRIDWFDLLAVQETLKSLLQHSSLKASILQCSTFFGEGNGTHSSAFAWKIPWTEEPGRLQSMRSLRVGHNWATSLSLFTFMHWRRKWQHTPVFLPGESQGRGSLVSCHLWSHTESDTTEVT